MRHASRIFFVMLTLTVLTVSSSPTFAKDKLVGIIWQVGSKGLDGKTGKLKWGVKFRATPDGKIWHVPLANVPQVIGSWNGNEENTKMKIDKVPESMPNLKQFSSGDYEFVLVGKDPKIWQGTFTHTSGLKVPIFCRLLLD